jgi:proline iminopeptidase
MTIRFVQRDGADLWTIATGKGTPMLICNGGPGCCDYLEPVAAMVDDMAQVVRFEQAGCGRSGARPSYNVEDCIADLETIRQSYGFEQWIVGGHSWGADLALAYALTFPQRVRGIICLAGGRIHNDREWHRAYEQNREEVGELLPDYLYPPNMEVNRQVGASWKRYIQRPTLLKELAELTTPTLFVYGKQDIRPSWPEEQLAHLMPNASLEIFLDAPHSIWMTHPSELRASLRHFLAGLDAQTG